MSTGTARRSWHRRATAPITFWLVFLAALGVVHRWVPSATWVLVHSFALGLLTNSILVWGQHFVETLLHRRVPEAATQSRSRLRVSAKSRCHPLGAEPFCSAS